MKSRSRKPEARKRPLLWLLASGCWVLACQRTTVPLPVLGGRDVPRIRATTLLIKTNLLPEQKAFLHLVIIANGKARIGNELDEWRLFDLDNNSVTFVDDIARTYRTESFDSLLEQKRELLRQSVPEFLPRAEFAALDQQRSFGDYVATPVLIRLGGYQRSLWMSTDPQLPERLFPLIVVSDPLTTPYSPILADVFEQLVKLRGFPVVDRSDVMYGGEPRVIEKRVLQLQHRRVPASWLQIPGDYKDLTPPPVRPRRAVPRRLSR